ncbi:MAG: MBL fold metallo-hydrolase [Acidimicrobiales bacterium]
MTSSEKPPIDLTWIGHATVLVDVAGYRVITDPLLTRRVAHLRRRHSIPDPTTTRVDLILLSHIHMDHLHLRSLRKLPGNARVLTPRGSSELVKRGGFTQVSEVGAGERVELARVTVDVTPAVHKGGRGPHTRMVAQPVGFVIELHGWRIYFAGDTDLFEGMADLGDIDVALLPIWGWGSSIGIGHMDPVRAAEATALIQPRFVVPIHWGTFAREDGRRRRPEWFEQPAQRFRQELEALGEVHRLRHLDPGASIALENG